MSIVNLRVQTLRPSEPWWPNADALGEKLSKLVRQNLATGAPTTAVVVRREDVTLVPLKPFVDAKMPIRVLLGGLARWNIGEEPPIAVGVIGRVRWRQGKTSPWHGLAVVFLEWPDGRWWQWRGLLDTQGQLIDQTSAVSRAEDGLARPSGLGGWWTFARRRRPNLKFHRRAPEITGPDPGTLIH